MSEKAVVVVDVASAAAAFVSLTVTVTGRGGQWPAEELKMKHSLSGKF